MLLSGKTCRLWNNQWVQSRKLTRHLFQQPQRSLITLLNRTQSNTMQRPQWRSLNNAMWTTIMFSTPRHVIVIIVRGIKGSLIIIIIIRPGDTSTITPLWQQWWIPTWILWEMTMNQYIPPEHPCKLQVLIKNSSPWRWRMNCTRRTVNHTQFYEN